MSISWHDTELGEWEVWLIKNPLKWPQINITAIMFDTWDKRELVLYW